jgi:hypothetical protein
LPPRAEPARVAVTPDGVFSGYAAIFARRDLGGDVIEPGAFAETLRARGGAAGLRVLFMHDPKEPIGTLELAREDGRGLMVRGRLIPGVRRAHEVYALVKAGALDGLSIGFKPVRARRDPVAGVRRLIAIDLWEVSLVTFPLMPEARLFRLAPPPSLLAKYSPDQPRVPAGQREGGQWTAGGGWTPAKDRDDPKDARGKEEGRVEDAVRRPPKKPGSGQSGGQGSGRPPNRPTFRPPDVPSRPEAAPPRPPPAANPPPARSDRATQLREERDRAVDGTRQRDPQWVPPPPPPSIAGGDDEPRALEFARDEAHWRLRELTRPSDPAERAARSIDDIIAPDGRPLGWRARGAGEEILTVTPRMFDALRDDLAEGATLVPPSERAGGLAGYRGEVFARENGELFGLRFSSGSGDTIDLFGRGGSSGIITKIHGSMR